MSDPVDIGDLETLLASKGWDWLMAQYEKHYGPKVVMDMIRKMGREDVEATVKADRIGRAVALQESMEAFLALPAKEISDRREAASRNRPDAVADQSRRGPGL